jgi:DNA-dependent RNA polymerase auxiliary subunit epsilon
MKLLKSSLIIFSSMGLLFLTACNTGNQASNSNTNPAVSATESSKPAVTPTTETNQSSPATSKTETAQTESHGESHGGQVVETGTYHLEFVPEKESNGTHLDLYLQKGDTHEAVTNAKVIAQVQSPDGKQQSLNLTYDAEGKHYTILFPGTTTGQYQVKMTADVSGENVNGRFNFQQ